MEKKKAANSQFEIEKYLSKEEAEIKSLFPKNIYDTLISIYSNGIRVPSFNISDYYTISTTNIDKLLKLETISIENRISKFIEKDIKKIEVELENQLYRLTDPNEIMKAKSLAKQETNKLIAKEDLIYTLARATHTEADNSHVIDTMGHFLLHFNDDETKKAILDFSAKSIRKKWLKYVLRTAQKDIELKFAKAVINSLKNKKSSWNIEILLNYDRTFITQEIKMINTNNDIRSLAFPPDGRFLAYGDSSTLTVLETSSLGNVKEVNTNNDIQSLAFSPDGRFLAYGDGRKLTVLETSSFGNVKEVKTNHNYYCYNNNYIRSVAFSPDGRFLAYGDGGTLTVLETSSFGNVKEVNTNNYIRSVAFSPDGRFLAYGGGSTLTVLETSYILIQHILLEHLLYLYHTANGEDIRHLMAAKKSAEQLPEQQRNALIELLDEIIERAGRSSTNIAIDTHNKPESTDITLE